MSYPAERNQYIDPQSESLSPLYESISLDDESSNNEHVPTDDETEIQKIRDDIQQMIPEERDPDQFEKDMKPPLSPKFNILYDGPFFKDIDWVTTHLNALADTSDLKTRVVIQRGNNRPKYNIDQVGKAMIFKQIPTLRDMFKSQEDEESKEVTVQSELNQGVSEIRIHDQMIIEALRKTDSKITAERFAQRLNTLIRGALSKVILREKIYQSGISSAALTLTTLPPIGAAFLGYEIGKGIPLNMSDIVQDRSMLDTLEYGGRITGIITLWFGAQVWIMASTEKIQALIQTNPYFKSNSDMNPLKHVKDLTMGQVYLATKGQELVSLHK